MSKKPRLWRGFFFVMQGSTVVTAQVYGLYVFGVLPGKEW